MRQLPIRCQSSLIRSHLVSEEQQVPLLGLEGQPLGEVVAESVERSPEPFNLIFRQKPELDDGVDAPGAAADPLADHLQQVVVEDRVGLESQQPAHELAPGDPRALEVGEQRSSINSTPASLATTSRP